MYEDELTRIPRDENDLWKVLRDHLDLAKMLFVDAAIEGEDDALDPEKRKKNAAAKAWGAMIPFRGTSVEWDNRDYFLDMGSSLIPYLEMAVEARDMTPEFVQQWGKFMFCHGFIASYALDDSDPLANKRGGVKTGRFNSKDAQRQWVARVLLALKAKGMLRAKAEYELTSHIIRALDDPSLRHGFEKTWFRVILNKRQELSSTFTEKREFSFKEMERLIAAPNPHQIPPIADLP